MTAAVSILLGHLAFMTITIRSFQEPRPACMFSLVLSTGRLPLVMSATPEMLIQPELGLSVSYLIFLLQLPLCSPDLALGDCHPRFQIGHDT